MTELALHPAPDAVKVEAESLGPDPMNVVTVDLDREWLTEAVQAVRRAAVLQQSGGWGAPDVAKLIAGISARLDSAPALLFDDFRDSPADRAIHVRSMDQDVPLWFVGDVHGDLLSLELALRYIKSRSPEANIVFLGDLFDAGPHSAAVVLRVWRRVLEDAAHTCILAGNHDEALAFGGESFSSCVTPSDLAGWINEHGDAPSVTDFGRTLVKFVATLPRALFLPDGLLVTHGGIPAADLYEQLKQSRDWNAALCMQDFVWTRWYPHKRRVRPHRNARDIGIGYETFAEFCALTADVDRPVSRLVRGHTHVEDCFELSDLPDQRGVLTINTMCTRDILRTDTEPYERQPVVAEWRRGMLPRVHRLAIPAEVIADVYPESDVAN